MEIQTAVGPLATADGTLTAKPEVKAELLQRVFSSCYVFDNGLIPATLRDAPSHCLDNISTTTDEVVKLLSQSPDINYDLDPITNTLLKQCSHHF